MFEKNQIHRVYNMSIQTSGGLFSFVFPVENYVQICVCKISNETINYVFEVCFTISVSFNA